MRDNFGLKNGSKITSPATSVRYPGTIRSIPANIEYILLVYCSYKFWILPILNKVRPMPLNFRLIK